jgi:hypothetical protein
VEVGEQKRKPPPSQGSEVDARARVLEEFATVGRPLRETLIAKRVASWLEKSKRAGHWND